MNSCSKVRSQRLDIIDALSELCIYMFPAAHYLCSAFEWRMVWDIVSLLCLGIGVLNMIMKKKIKLHGYEAWIMLFFLCSMISTVFSSNIDQCLAGLMIQIRMMVYCLFFMMTVIQKKKYIKHCFLSILLVSVAVAIIAITNTDIGSILTVKEKYLSAYRVGLSAEENVNITAFNMSVGFIMASLYINTYVERNDKAQRVLIRICQLVIITGIFFTGARKSLLCCAVVAAFEFFDIKKSRKIFYGLIVFSIVVYAFMTIPLLYRLVGSRIENFLTGQIDVSDMTRQRLAEKAKEIFFANPVIGVGSDGFKWAASGRVYAHNNLLEILADFGILGFSVYYSIFAVILYKIRRTAFDYRQRTVVFGGIAAYFTMEFTQVSYQLLTGTVFLSLLCVYLDCHARYRYKVTVR